MSYDVVVFQERCVILFFITCAGIRAEQFRQQYFRIEPENTKAQEGSEVTLQCEIEHLKGKVQWTKDGFALGKFTKILVLWRIFGRFSFSIFGDISERNKKLRYRSQF